MSTTQSKGVSTNRFAYVDALRGMAALWVVLYHFAGERRPLPPAPALGEFFTGLLDRLHSVNVAIDTFFILSGFVIAIHIGSSRITARYAGRFIVRRAIRLDLPYWTIFLIAIGCGWTSRLLLGDSHAAVPGDWRETFANVFYLQTLLGYKSYLPVAWTLCLEVQFYLSMLAILGAAQWIVARLGASSAAEMRWTLVALTPATLYSLLIRSGMIAAPVNGLVFDYWFLVQLGILAGWAHAKQVSHGWFLSYACLIVGWFVFLHDAKSLLSTLIGISVHVGSRTGFLTNGLSWRPLQYLGRISFSLYLVHLVFGIRVLSLGYRISGPSASLLVCSGYLLAAIGVSFVTAHFFYRFVEQPAQRLSQRIRLPKAVESASQAPASLPPDAETPRAA
jgi:peptidoglycan/LPS O-acetylase OafA/YrhL